MHSLGILHYINAFSNHGGRCYCGTDGAQYGWSDMPSYYCKCLYTYAVHDCKLNLHGCTTTDQLSSLDSFFNFTIVYCSVHIC